MILLSKLAVAQTLLASNHRADPTFLALPLPRIVYRVGFMHYATKTTDQMRVNMLRMRRIVFEKLCTLLTEEGGLRRSKNMDVEEMVAIFLVTVGHNIKNRKAQFLFQRSAETISRVIKLVLLSILKLESHLLPKPTSVPQESTAAKWKYFPGGALRDCGYSDIEKQLKVLVPDTKHNADSIKGKFRVFKGKFHAQLDLMNASGMGWNADKSCCECDPEVLAGWVKSHKLAAGLNNTKLHRWDELCKIFEVHRADGTSSMMAKDAASRLEGQLRSPPPASDTYAAETTPMMEDFINQGYDMNAEGLQDIEEDTATNQSTNKGKGTSSAGSKRSRAQVTEEYLASINENMVSFQEHIARTTTNIERLTNNWCMPEDVASRRAYMMDEIKRLPGISYRQGLLAMRILMKDPADWETFCMLPTDETKADFILTILEYVPSMGVGIGTEVCGNGHSHHQMLLIHHHQPCSLPQNCTNYET
ncbi:hypothetical protein LINPERPRIM_LOCUS30581 [Linum perenne]